MKMASKVLISLLSLPVSRYICLETRYYSSFDATTCSTGNGPLRWTSARYPAPWG